MSHHLFKFPTDANYYDLAEAARKMRISVKELEEMAYETEVDADVVGWICHKMHDGTWQLRLFGRMDYNSNAGEDILNIDMRKFWLDTEERNRKRDRWKRE